jgi:hypothetical protein
MSENEQTSQLAKRVSSLKVLLMAAVALLSGGFGMAMYLTRYALAEDFDRHVSESEKTHRGFEGKLSDHEIDIAVTKEGLRRIEEDLHWQRDQATATARRIGAPVVPAPHHEGRSP